jgi:porin
VNLYGEVDFPTRFFDLPGNHVLSLVWSNRERTSYDVHHAITLPDGGLAPGSKDSTWNVWYSMDQYLHVDPDDPVRGWGLFGKVEFSGGDPNPLDTVANFGFGGTGPTASRRLDRWGIGVYFADVSDALKEALEQKVDLEREWGMEAFYSVALTPAMALSFDAQVLRSVQSDNWQSVLGLRLNTRL